MAIIPFLGTFTETLLLAFVGLTIVITTLLLLSLRKKQEPYRFDHPRLVKITSWAILTVATFIPILVVFPNDSVSMPIAFFILEGALSALSAIYLALGGKSRMLLAYALLAASISITTAVVVKNNFYPMQRLTQDPIYISRSISYYQSITQQGFYYLIPVGAISSVTLGEISGANLGLSILTTSIPLVATLFGLWAFFERVGLRFAYPALFFVFTPELSFITGRTEGLPYVALALLLVALAATRKNRNDVALLLPAIALGVFAHPIAPIALITLLAVLSFYLALRRIRWMDQYHIVLAALRLTLAVTGVYWFLTYIYTLILPHATSTLNATLSFLASLLLGQSSPLGSGITSLLAPGYSGPQFRIFAYIWATPVAFALSLLIVMIIRRRSMLKGGSKASKDMVSSFALSFGIAASISTLVLIGVAYAAYAASSLQGQYLIPAGYFVAIMGSAYVINQLIGDRRLVVVSLTAILLFTAIDIGTYSPDWAPLEHQDFQVSATIHPYSSYIQGNTITSLAGNRSSTVVYNDYDITVGSGKLYKPLRQVIFAISQGQSTFDQYNGSLFVLLNNKLGNANMSSQVLASDIVYSSNSHFVLVPG